MSKCDRCFREIKPSEEKFKIKNDDTVLICCKQCASLSKEQFDNIAPSCLSGMESTERKNDAWFIFSMIVIILLVLCYFVGFSQMKIAIIIIAIYSIHFAILCSLIANQNGRESSNAFWVGFLFGIFALIYYCAIGESKERKIANIVEAHKILNSKIDK